MTFEPTQEQARLIRDIAMKNSELHVAQNQLALLCCPHKIGDVMVSSKNAYRARITGIKYSFLTPYYCIVGSIIRSNGTLAANTITLSEVFGNWKREERNN